MQFGEVAVAEAEGGILAHSLRLGAAAFKKGRVLSATDVAALGEGGIARVVIARLGDDDVEENAAAFTLAKAASGANLRAADPFTGRANLHAEARGLLVFDRARLDRLNLVDEAVTLGTLPEYTVVEPRQMVATVKIIPFAAPRDAVEACTDIATEGGPLLRVAAFRAKSVALIQTRLPGLKESILDKTRQVTEARLSALGCRLVREERCGHVTGELSRHIEAAVRDSDMVLVHGASAILDRRDVIPAAIVAAGGEIEHFGMPVDPGNLLLLGRAGGKPVLGLPGCARSPKVNGFDWVLERLVADVPVGREDIMRLGAGGLLAEIPTRPQPRAGAEVKPGPKPVQGPRIAAILLAAGKSSRMGGPNKMLAEIEGRPMVARVAQRLLSSHARPIVAVLGNMADEVDAAIGKLPVERVRNPDYADGLSTSLKRGLAALPPDIDGALVCLGDMPMVTGRDLDRLIGAFNPLEGRAIVVPVRQGTRGNPILWASRFFPEMAALSGDVGARALIAEHGELVAEIEMDSDAVLVDIDTQEALAEFREKASPTAA
ncbi:MAG TPA: molybdopterin-binding/glycosyltransferase family 2 protein [Stellaceae bacterium]|jgi:molybdenum cofactor cytidylyltransferase|nr:molybdopterin-binding/glycosyltransferase family 2 protein [Stellaceae bacterium]